LNESEVITTFDIEKNIDIENNIAIEKNIDLKNHIPVPYVFIATQTRGGNSGKTIFSIILH
jgi:hypothetical protein